MSVSTNFGVREKELEWLLTILTIAQEKREFNTDFIWHPICGETLAWVVYELEEMTAATNLLREKYKLPTVSHVDVWNKCDQQASGHSDYTKKYALYCLELGRGEIVSE